MVDLTIPILIYKRADGHFEVEHDQKICDGLAWDEMLGQIALMTADPAYAGKGRYAMHRPETWAQMRARFRPADSDSDEVPAIGPAIPPASGERGASLPPDAEPATPGGAGHQPPGTDAEVGS